MTTSIKYLEWAQLEQLANQFQRDGYNVTVRPLADEGDGGYDLVAAKPGKRIAVEVKANSELGTSAHQIKELRRKAFDEGFDEFRLVVANPPHETDVRIEGLERKLASYMGNDLPQELRDITGTDAVRATAAKGVEINSLEVSLDSIRVAGSGVVSVEISFSNAPPDPSAEFDRGDLGYASGSPILGDEQDAPWVGWVADLPFSFDVELNRALEIVRANTLAVDTRSLFD
jgi:hypothetical protein